MTKGEEIKVLTRIAVQRGLEIEELQSQVESLQAASAMRVVQEWMFARSLATGHGDTAEDMLNEAEWQIAEAMRVKCEEIVRDYTFTRGEAANAIAILRRMP
jgi:hypothetical protein